MPTKKEEGTKTTVRSEQEIIQLERKRTASIISLCEKHGIPVAEKERYISSDLTIDQVRSSILDYLDQKIQHIDHEKEINTVCSRHFIPDDMRKRYISDGLTIEEVRMKILDYMESQSPRIQAGEDSRDKFRNAATHGVMLRYGIPGAERSEAGELGGYTLKELARESLRVSNQAVRTADSKLMVGRAFTTTDFPHIIDDVANRVVVDGFEKAKETWPEWCGTGTANNFLKQELDKASSLDSLERVHEGAEYKYGKINVEKEEYQIGTYGRLFPVTRQAIINDSNGIFDKPRIYGENAANTIGEVVVNVLVDNGNMGDGVALFHSNHNNLGSSGGDISIEAISAIETAMSEQTDTNGKSLNIDPIYIISHKTHKLKILSVLNQTTIPVGTQDEPNKSYYNPYRDGVLQPVFDSRLPKTAYFVASTKGKTVVVYFLDGIQKPRLETKQGWSIDGVEYKISIDVGAKAIDWRGLYKQPIA